MRGARPQAPHLGVHRGHRPGPRNWPATPEKQEWLRRKEGCGKCPPRVHTLEDIDSKFGAVSIRRGVQVVRGSERVNTVAFTPLKTKRSHRVVQLPPFALARIRGH